MEEGIVIGGGCTLLKLAQAVEGIKAGLDNDEQKVRQSSWTLFKNFIVLSSRRLVALVRVAKSPGVCFICKQRLAGMHACHKQLR